MEKWVMDLERMLDKCVKGQWRVDQLDWTVKARPMKRDEEIAIVQYFHDMAGIEKLAGALFEEQRRLTNDPILKKIFATFVADEERHSQVATRLAAHYNVNHYQLYQLSPELVKFRPHFLRAIGHVSPEIANIYITSGELMLDIALLRSLNDYVNDEMSNQAMELINRDESRHIAMDYYMMEYYASDEYQQNYKKPQKSARELAEATWAFSNMLYYARPFMLTVFLAPMNLTDPQGVRTREAFKRMQLLSFKPNLVKRPFQQFLYRLRQAHNHPVIGKVFGEVISRIGGAPGEYMQNFYTDEEAQRAAHMSLEEMAEEAVGAKYLN
jgi:hypothetical protein